MKTCKKVKRNQLKKEKTKKQQQDLSCDLMTQLKKWAEEDIRGKSNQKTRVKYLKYVETILAYFDHKVKSFHSWELLDKEPAEMPQVDSFLETIKSPSMKSQYLCGYQFLIRFLMASYRERDLPGVEFWKKQAYLSHLRDLEHNAQGLFSLLNKQIERRRLINKETRSSNPSILTFNLKRAEELFNILWESRDLSKIITRLEEGRLSDMERESGWDNIKIRDLLTSLLVVFGGGARGSVVTRMTIQEFSAAKKADNGQWQVMVP